MMTKAPRYAAIALAIATAIGFSMQANAARTHVRGSHHSQGRTAHWHGTRFTGANGGTLGHGARSVRDHNAQTLTRTRGTKATGPNGGTFKHGARTVYGADGTIAHQGGTRITGANGGTATGHNNYTRNADGSAAFARSADASSANGSTYSHDANWAKSVDGSRSGSAQTSIDRANGASYDRTLTAGDGTATRNTDATVKSGASYSGETSWTKGEGVTHTGTCTDPQGNTISCPGRSG